MSTRQPTGVSRLAALASLACLLGCTLPANPANGVPTIDRSANFTQAALEIQGTLTAIASGAQPTVTPLGSQVGTTIPVLLPTSTNLPAPEITAQPGTPCNRAEFVNDVTVPDGTVFLPGDTFVKTWRLRNSGSCTWTTDYVVVFDTGDAMGGPATFPISTASVPPGAEVDLSINLTAPESPGTYRGNWKLRNPAGEVFGTGSQGDAPFWVEIKVENDFGA